MVNTAYMLTTKQAAESLGISPNAILGAIKLGTLPATKRDGVWQISEAAVEDYRRDHRGRQGKLPEEKAKERALKAAQTAKSRRGISSTDDDAVTALSAQLFAKLFTALEERGVLESYGVQTPPAPDVPKYPVLSAPVIAEDARPPISHSQWDQLLRDIADLKRRIDTLESRAWRSEAGAI